MKTDSGKQIHDNFRYVPLVRTIKTRTITGFVLLVLSVTLAGKISGEGRLEVIVLITISAWIIAVFLTDKYVHKYPQRYYTYLIASHLKAAVIMAVLLWITGWVGNFLEVPRDVLWTGFFLFVFTDALASVPHRRDIKSIQYSAVGESRGKEEITNDQFGGSGNTSSSLSPIDTQSIMRHIPSDLDKSLAEFIKENFPDLHGSLGTVMVLDDTIIPDERKEPVGLLVSRIRINDIRRINRFFLSCAKRISMEGYFVGRYLPLEDEAQSLKRRDAGLLYWPVFILRFIWYRAFPKIPWLNALYFSVTNGKNRVLSKVEVWGRLSYCGMRVIAESTGDGEKYLIAQRVATPVQNKRPSYYPIVALEKVGLDGEIVRTHKIRTMFPFSEFLQKRMFEDHGLAPTGKFANDFRLTEYGKFLRKYWLDELPQIFDWLRGDVKLFGMRATSRHYLCLYPKELYDLYIQVKPGLIPPIFDESTTGLEKIAEVELAYLKRYREQPFRTDVRYLIQTIKDIVVRGVRSK